MCMLCNFHTTAQIGMNPICAIFVQFAKCTNREGSRIDPRLCNLHTTTEHLAYNPPHMALYIPSPPPPAFPFGAPPARDSATKHMKGLKPYKMASKLREAVGEDSKLSQWPLRLHACGRTRTDHYIMQWWNGTTCNNKTATSSSTHTTAEQPHGNRSRGFVLILHHNTNKRIDSMEEPAQATHACCVSR